MTQFPVSGLSSFGDETIFGFYLAICGAAQIMVMIY